MLYRLDTNVNTPKFNIRIRVREGKKYTSVRLDQYEYLTVLAPDDPGLPGLNCYVLNRPLDPACFETENGLSAGTDGKKRPDINKIPDFWTTDPLPIVTQEFKDLIEEVDGGVHQFFEFQLFYHKTNEPIEHTRFYTFVCGRLLEVQPADVGPKPASFSARGLMESEALMLRTVQTRADIQAYVSELPLWSFREGGRRAYFLSASLLKLIRSRGLNGFTDYNDRARGNVGYVKFEA